MAAELSLAASIISVLELSTTVVGYLRAVKKGPADRVRIIADINSARDLLFGLCELLDDAKGKDGAQLAGVEALEVPGGPLDRFTALLERISKRLDVADNANGWRKVKEALVWPFTMAEAKEILRDLEQLKSSLVLALQADSARVLGVLQEGVSRIQLGIHDSECQTILAWLSGTCPEKKLIDISARLTANTGEWFLNHDKYRKWRDGTGSNLWCRGIPGAGKTFISSLAIDDLQQRTAGTPKALAYYFFSHDDQKNQFARNVAASLLRTIAIQRNEIPDAVGSLYKTFGKNSVGGVPFPELKSALCEACHEFQEVLIVFDALDECEGFMSRPEWRDLIKALLAVNVKFLVTSRPHLEGVDDMFNIASQIVIEATANDIRTFLDATINNHRESADILTGKLKQEVLNKLVNGSSGMFLLPALQIQLILEQPTRTDIRKALAEIPQQLHACFEGTIERIKKQPPAQAKLGIRALMWLAHAERPLRIVELSQALSVEDDQTSLDTDGMPSEKRLIQYCLGLATIEREAKIIRLSHAKVAEFLLVRSQDIFCQDAHGAMAKACVTFLLFDAFDQLSQLARGTYFCQDIQDKPPFDKHPLFFYAALAWSQHERKSSDAASVANEALVSKYFSKGKSLGWTPEWQTYGSDAYDSTTPFQGATEMWWRWLPRRDEARCLSAAVKYNLPRHVERLLAQGIDPNTKDDKLTPMVFEAFENRNMDILDRLLRYGAEVNTWNGVQHLLHAVAQDGEPEMVKYLLDKGANIEAENIRGTTALYVALNVGSFSNAEVLMEHGAKVEGTTSLTVGTCLTRAINQEKWETAAFLLQHGANPDARDDFRLDRTSLMIAADMPNAHVVDLLLEFGADPHAKTTEGETVLWYATNADSGSEKRGVVRRLLELGVDVNPANKYGYTPLLVVLRVANREQFLDNGGEREKLLQLLLEYGADIRAESIYGESALLLTIPEWYRYPKDDLETNISEFFALESADCDWIERVRTAQQLLNAGAQFDTSTDFAPLVLGIKT